MNEIVISFIKRAFCVYSGFFFALFCVMIHVSVTNKHKKRNQERVLSNSFWLHYIWKMETKSLISIETVWKLSCIADLFGKCDPSYMSQNKETDFQIRTCFWHSSKYFLSLLSNVKLPVGDVTWRNVSPTKLYVCCSLCAVGPGKSCVTKSFLVT